MKALYFSVRTFQNGNRLNITGYRGTFPNRREYVRGQLTRMPGSPTIWVSHGLYVSEEHRGKGYSQAYNSFMLHRAWVKLDASAVIASVKYDNEVQHNRLRRFGWRQISNAMYIVTPSPNDSDDDSYSTLFTEWPPLNNTVDWSDVDSVNTHLASLPSPWKRTVTWSKS